MANRALVGPPLSELNTIRVLSRRPFLFQGGHNAAHLVVQGGDHARIDAALRVGDGVLIAVGILLAGAW